MSFVAVAVGGSAIAGLAGSAMQAGAAEDAATMQAKAAQEANALQSKMWDEQKAMYEAARNQQRADLDPWRTAGVGALGDMGASDFKRDFGMSDFQKDPGYEFRMAEGQKALERSAAARGGLQGGATLKALSRYGQDFASSEYQNAYNRFNADRDRRFGRLSSIAGMGQAAAAGQAASTGQSAAMMGAAGSNYANAVGSNSMGAANAQGAAGIAGANAWAGGLSNLASAGMTGAALAGGGGWMNRWKANQAGGTPLAGQSYADMGGMA